MVAVPGAERLSDDLDSAPNAGETPLLGARLVRHVETRSHGRAQPKPSARERRAAQGTTEGGVPREEQLRCASPGSSRDAQAGTTVVGHPPAELCLGNGRHARR